MARKNTNIGDVFIVELDNDKKKYFQLIAFDSTQLNSDVIRVFKEEYPSEGEIDLIKIVNSQIDFYAHCVTKFGLKMGLWEKLEIFENLEILISYSVVAGIIQK